MTEESLFESDVETPAPIKPNGAAPEMARCPSPLHTAIHAILGEVRRLEKSDHNKHGNYDFAPADAFRDFIRDQFHKHKLVYSISEVYASQVAEGMKAGTIKFTYWFVITHVESGEQTQPEARSVFLPYVGSQTSGIASTFALKEWLKNKFLISTGEPDPEGEMGDHDSNARNRLPDEESGQVLETLRAELKDAIKDKRSQPIEAWWKASEATAKTLTPDHFGRIKREMLKAWQDAKDGEMTEAELDARAMKDK